MAFAELKAKLNKVAAPTIDDLCSAIGAAIGQFTPSECRNDLQPAAYDVERSEKALVPRFRS